MQHACDQSQLTSHTICRKQRDSNCGKDWRGVAHASSVLVPASSRDHRADTHGKTSLFLDPRCMCPAGSRTRHAGSVRYPASVFLPAHIVPLFREDGITSHTGLLKPLPRLTTVRALGGRLSGRLAGEDLLFYPEADALRRDEIGIFHPKTRRSLRFHWPHDQIHSFRRRCTRGALNFRRRSSEVGGDGLREVPHGFV